MKKIAISLLALAAVSTVAVAGESRNNPRDSDAYFGQSSNLTKDQSTSTSALAVGNGVQVWTLEDSRSSEDRQRSRNN